MSTELNIGSIVWKIIGANDRIWDGIISIFSPVDCISEAFAGETSRQESLVPCNMAFI